MYSYEALDSFLDFLRSQHLELTYPEVLLHTRASSVLPSEARLDSRFSRNVPVRVPIVSAAMDTVTEVNMAIAMARFGGLGTIHKSMTPEEQARMVARVKHDQNGFISDPRTILEKVTVRELEELRRSKQYKFRRFPVLNNEGKFVGLVTGRDLQFCIDPSLPVSAIMTPRRKLAIAKADIDKKEAYALMLRSKVESLPVINKKGEVAGLYLFEDLRRIFSEESTANVDSNDQLRVAAAVGVGSEEMKRVDALIHYKCDVLVVDTAHGNSSHVLAMIKDIKRYYPNTDVVAGNVSNEEGVLALAQAGCDGIRVGQGPGSICITRIQAGVGGLQASAVGNCAQALRREGHQIPVCADGGIVNPGDVVMALALGASSVTCGGVLAGTDEAPGQIVLSSSGTRVKHYRGMGSLGAMRDSRAARERYQQGDTSPEKLVAEGVEAAVPYRGSVFRVLEELAGALRIGMGYLGARTVAELPLLAIPSRITAAGARESGPHDVILTTIP